MSDRFEAMQAFIAVCDTKGFSPAARRLQLSASAVTRLVGALEERLGVRLLHRTTRSLKLTDAGARFLERARQILLEMEEAEFAAQEEHAEPRGRLTISAPILFGRMHVAPVISGFLKTYPQVSAELQLSDTFVNIVEERIDVGVRIGQLADSSLVARRLGQTRRLLIATPRYLADAGGAPVHPADLAAHRMIAFRTGMLGREWLFRTSDGNSMRIEAEPRFMTNNGDAAIGHALEHGGITSAFCYQVHSLLAKGCLIEVLPDFAPLPVPIQAVFPTSKLLSTKVRAFLNALTEASLSWSFLPGAETESPGIARAP